MKDWDRAQYVIYWSALQERPEDAKILVTRGQQLMIIEKLLQLWPTDPPVDPTPTPE